METKFNFKFIGWCKEGTHDKVWGYFSVGDWQPGNRWEAEPCYIFWGRRGKTMNFKKDEVTHELSRLQQTKLNKGYVRINEAQLLEIWPTFYDDAEMRLSFCLLANKVR